jgi:hypothetical protein
MRVGRAAQPFCGGQGGLPLGDWLRELLPPPAVAVGILEEHDALVVELVAGAGWPRLAAGDHLDLAHVDPARGELLTNRAQVLHDELEALEGARLHQGSLGHHDDRATRTWRVETRARVVDEHDGRVYLKVQKLAFDIDGREAPADYQLLLPRDTFEHPPVELEGVAVRTASPRALHQLRIGIASQGSFGPLSAQQRESARRLKETFFLSSPTAISRHASSP